MPFNVEKPKSNFKKSSFLTLTPGVHIIRILTSPDDAKLAYSHYIPGSGSVTCLGDDCPLCDTNRKIYAQFPDSFRQAKGYYPRQRKFVMNVLDRTMAKVCPSCGIAIKNQQGKYPATCPECNAFINSEEAKPLNKVCILSIGADLATNLNGIEVMAADPQTGEPTPITTFDVSLLVEGKGTTRNITPMPLITNRDVVTVDESELNDLDSTSIKLSVDEIKNLLSGVSMRDIFSARKAEETSTPAKAESIEPPFDVSGIIDNIF